MLTRLTFAHYALGFLLALLLLAALRLPLLRCEPFIAGAPFFLDEQEYIEYANAFASGNTAIETLRPWTRAPETAFVLLLLARLRELPPELVACDYQVLQTALWAGVLGLISASAGLLFGRRTALLTALCVAILPDGISLALLVHSDLLFCFWLALTVFALLMHARGGSKGWLIVGGLAAGSGALARSPMLPILPVLILWAGVHDPIRQLVRKPAAQRRAALQQIAEPTLDMQRFRTKLRRMPGWFAQRLKQHVLPGAIFLGCALLVIGPWTVRNYRVHGGLIVSDTLGALNLFNDNTPDRHTAYAEVMAAAATPIARQQYATRRAVEIIVADPARFLSKFAYTSALAWSPPDFTATWNFWQGLIERPRTAALLAQLDTVLFGLVPLALLGLVLAPTSAAGARSHRNGVAVLALCYTGMIGLTHFEPRFRTPFLLLLLPYAAWSVAHLRTLLYGLRRPAALVVLAASLVLLVSFAGSIWPDQWANLRALALHGRGILRTTWGDPQGALADQQAAAQLQPELREARVAAAQLLVQRGDLAQAEALLRAALELTVERNERLPADVVVALQRVLLAQGRSAEATALDQQLAIPMRQRAEAIAWPAATPRDRLALGVNDLGLVRGFYSAQTSATDTFRWSGPTATLRLQGDGDYVCLRINAARPNNVPAPTIQLRTQRGALLGQLKPPRNGWGWFCAPLPAAQSARLIDVTLHTASYNPYVAGASVDPRNLGVAVAEAVLRTGPLTLDPQTGLLLDRAAAPAATQPLQLLGLTGVLRGAPGTTLPLTIWWRSAEPPPSGSFTFLHLLNAAGDQVATYNSPLAAGQFPNPWQAAEPLADQAALALPTDLAPGQYRLVGGAFEPATGVVLAQADFGTLDVTP